MAPQPQRPWILQQTEQSEQINPQVPGPEKLVYEGGKNHHVSDPQRCPPFLTFDFGLANCLVWIVLDRPGSSWLDWLDWLDPPAHVAQLNPFFDSGLFRLLPSLPSE
jgi:hypothetical protein